MADKVQIAIKRERAMKRLIPALQSIAAYAQVDVPDMPTFSRDRDYLHASQLDALAGWAENVAAALWAQQAESTAEGQTDEHTSDPASKPKPRRNG